MGDRREREAVDADGAVARDAENDVVDATLSEDGEEHQAHLVEGDFFPDAPVDSVAGEEGEEATAILLALSSAEAPPSRREGEKRSVSPERRRSAAGRRKRVRWADECDDKRALVRHVTTFFMPHGSYAPGMGLHDGEPASPLYAQPVTLPAPTSVFREKENSDGSVYKFCKAQRASQHFVEWRRVAHEPGSTPFDAQPAGAGAGASRQPARTLFAALYPRRAHMRRPDAPPRTRAAGRQGDCAAPQMPAVSINAPYDAPLQLPL